MQWPRTYDRYGAESVAVVACFYLPSLPYWWQVPVPESLTADPVPLAFRNCQL
jgi:hypothetical protein